MLQRMFSALIFLCIMHISLSNEQEIVKTIFKDYEQRIRPVINTSTATVISIFPVYLNVLEMNTAEETVKFSMDYKQTWKDDYLQWNPSDFNGVQYIRVPEEMLWTPDTYLEGSIEINLLLPIEKRKVQVFHNGDVSMFNPQIINHHCAMKIENFPYDSQKCNILFTTWSYTSDQVILNIVPPVHGNMYDNIEGNPEWKMVSFKSSVDVQESVNIGSYTRLLLTFELKRNSVYYICVLIIPSFILVTLCLLGIFAPNSNSGERQEKVTLGLTSLLTMAVILNIVADHMPKATKLPILGYFVLAEIFISTLAILVSIVIMFLHQRALSKSWVPPERLMKLLHCKQKGITNSAKSHSLFSDTVLMSNDKLINAKTLKMASVLKIVLEWIEESKQEKALIATWADIFDSVDLICLVIFQVGNIIVSACLIL